MKEGMNDLALLFEGREPLAGGLRRWSGLCREVVDLHDRA